MKFLYLWFRWFQIALHAEMVYRWNFFFKVMGIVLVDMFTPFAVFIIYTLSPGIPGWNMYEFILLVGIFTLVMGIWHAFFSGIAWLTTEIVLHGELDNVLVRPYNTLSYLMAAGVDIEGFGEIIAGLAIILLAVLELSITISLLNVAYMLLILFLALIFTFSISVFIAALSVKFVQATALLDLFYHTMEFGKNPLTIYGAAGVAIFTFILPFGLAAFYPAQALLGTLSLDIFVKLIIVTLFILIISKSIWNYSLHSYSSAGG